MKRILILGLILIVYFSCTFSTKKNITSNYYLLSTIENDHSRYIGYKLLDGSFISISPNGVKEYTHDANYIYINRVIFNKIHPRGVKEYYIIPVFSESLRFSEIDGILGPFDYKAFCFKLIQLGVNENDLNFND